VFGAILALQIVARLVGSRETEHRRFALQTVFLAGVFLLWAPRHDRATGATSSLVTMLADGINFGSDAAQRAGSVASIGGSIEVLFLKLFLVTLVFCALAGLLVLGGFLGRFEDSPELNSFARYLGLALVPLLGLFAAYLLVNYEKLHFRQLGFVMVLVTILGSIALARGMEHLSTRFSPGTARAAVGVVVVVMLALSVPMLYQSPYMYQSSSHVTDAQMTGYETAFEHQGSAPFIGIRGSGERWSDAVLGFEQSRERELTARSLYTNERHPAIGENFTGSYVARHYDDRYLAFTDRLRRQEVETYNGLRFDRRGFRSLDATPGLNRVQSNGGFQMYRVNATS